MWDSGSRVGYWVVVNGLDDAGRVIIQGEVSSCHFEYFR